MPTSSQAMILKNKGLENADPFWKKPSERAISPCPVSNVDLNEMFDRAYREYGARILQGYIDGPQQHAKDKLSKVLKIRGLRTVLTYDPVNGSFSWKFTSGKQKGTQENNGHGNERPKTSIPENRKNGGILKKESWVNPEQRSKSACHWSDKVEAEMLEKEFQISAWESLPDNILSLGFRKPKRAHMGRRGKSAPNLHTHQTEPKTTAKEEVEKEYDKEEKESENEFLISTQRLHGEIAEALKPTPITTEEYECTCLPSVYLRKKQENRRPLVVCFSLRDNEAMSHLELKNHIKYETGLDVKILQYEPLSIRSGDPSVNGRWLATMGNLFDVYRIIQEGFYMKRDHIIVKSYDDICDRELKNYTYLQGLKDEKKQLNLPGKSMHRVKSGKLKAKSMRH